MKILGIKTVIVIHDSAEEEKLTLDKLIEIS